MDEKMKEKIINRVGLIWGDRVAKELREDIEGDGINEKRGNRMVE